jgi:hypothetical protein
MSLWAPVIFSTEQGLDLQALGPSFVGRHVIPRYRGYMQSQAGRLLGIRTSSGHGRRGGGGREELISEFGYDTKYAMHCARLGFQCQELLNTGGLALPMQGEPAEWLLRVRRGEVPFDEWWERTLELDATLEVLESDTTVPDACDVQRIERWTVDAHLALWSEAT